MLLLFYSCYLCGFSQGVFSNNINTALQKVVGDYPNNFRNIKGELVSRSDQAVNYQSRVVIPGSVNCFLTRVNDVSEEIYTWNCTFLESSDFGTTKGKFKELYDQIRNTIIKIEGHKPCIVNGQFEAPLESKKGTTIIFELLPASCGLQNLKVELTLEQHRSKWQILLKVYDLGKYTDQAARISW